MKVLHVTKKYPDALGGDAVVVSNLQKCQQAAGHQVVILTSQCPEIKRGPGIYHFGLPSTAAALDHIGLKRIISLAGLFYTSFKVLFHERPDVVHTHCVDLAFCMSLAAHLFRIPLVHTFHIVTFYDNDQPMLRRKSELLLAKAARLQTITAPNARAVAILQKAGLPQTVLLSNGVDLGFWRPRPKAAPGGTFTFVSVGRLEVQKGYHYLIKAAAQLSRATARSFRVLVVGEGTQQTPLHQMAQEYHMQNTVLFMGRKTPSEVRALFRNADAAVFPSLYETTPITVLEAWAMGVPVVATSVGILSDAPSGTQEAYVVEPKSESSLFKAMQRCMDNDAERARVARTGQKSAKQYSWPVIAGQAENVYGSVL